MLNRFVLLFSVLTACAPKTPAGTTGGDVDTTPTSPTGNQGGPDQGDKVAPSYVALDVSDSRVFVGESVTLTASAEDAVGVTKIEFYDGATKLAEVTTSPFTTSVASPSPGSRSFTAKAFDAAGNSASSSAVALDVVRHKLWHASFGEKTLRGFSETHFGAAVPGSVADTKIDLSACANATPNAVVQDANGNLIFTDRLNGAVVHLAYELISAGGMVAPTALQCVQLQTGLTEAIGLALDSDRRSVFVAHQNGISYIKYDGVSAYAAAVNLVSSGGPFSGLQVDGDRLYAASYSGTPSLNLYTLNGARTSATLAVGVHSNVQPFNIPEGVAIAAGQVWVASNSADNIVGFDAIELEVLASLNPGTQQVLDTYKLIYQAAGSTLHCPGALAADSVGNLWVNVQGSDDAGNCTSDPANPGNIYSYSAATLAFAGVYGDAPTLKIENVASIPGFGGMAFGF